MPNYYTNAICEQPIKCSKEEYEELKVLLGSKDTELEGEEPHGFELEYWEESGDLVLSADEFAAWSYLPEKFMDRMGEILTKAGLPYWEFGVAFTASKLCIGSCGGTKFRIMPDGSIVDRVEMWPGDSVIVENPVPSET